MKFFKIIIFITANSMFLIGFSVSAQTLPVKNYTVENISVEPFIDSIKRTGKITFKRTLNLSFKAGGFLKRLNIDEGETFSNKKLLASLDVTELKANKNATYARLLQAKRNINRTLSLLEKKLSSQAELDNAQTEVDVARATYKVAFYNLEKAQVYAPFDGVVVARYTEIGELQYPSNPILQVAALKNNLVVKVALTGEEISLVKLKQKVKVSLAHLGDVEGYISKIPAISDKQSQLFNIEVLLPETLPNINTNKPLIAGQIAQITIHIETQDYIYRLPIAALNGVDHQGNALVVIKKQNKLIKQTFDIYKVDNNYLYLQANGAVKPLDIVTKGWQHLSINIDE